MLLWEVGQANHTEGSSVVCCLPAAGWQDYPGD